MIFRLKYQISRIDLYCLGLLPSLRWWCNNVNSTARGLVFSVSSVLSARISIRLKPTDCRRTCNYNVFVGARYGCYISTSASLVSSLIEEVAICFIVAQIWVFRWVLLLCFTLQVLILLRSPLSQGTSIATSYARDVSYSGWLSFILFATLITCFVTAIRRCYTSGHTCLQATHTMLSQVAASAAVERGCSNACL